MATKQRDSLSEYAKYQTAGKVKPTNFDEWWKSYSSNNANLQKLPVKSIVKIKEQAFNSYNESLAASDKAKHEKNLKEQFVGQEYLGQTEKQYRDTHFTNWAKWQVDADKMFAASAAASATGLGSNIPYVGKALNKVAQLSAISMGAAAINKAIAEGMDPKTDVNWDMLGAKLGLSAATLYGLSDATIRLQKGDKWYKPKVVNTNKPDNTPTFGTPAKDIKSTEPPKVSKSDQMKAMYRRAKWEEGRAEQNKIVRKENQSADSKAKYQNYQNQTEAVETKKPVETQQWVDKLNGTGNGPQLPFQLEIDQAREAAGHRHGGGVHQLSHRLNQMRGFKTNFNKQR